MKAQIVRIGNSRGIRIPRAVIEQTGLGDVVELEVRRGALLIRRPSRPRTGWDDAFRRMAEQGDDAWLDRGATRETEWEAAEWRW
jgi:antitoxin MazE